MTITKQTMYQKEINELIETIKQDIMVRIKLPKLTKSYYELDIYHTQLNQKQNKKKKQRIIDAKKDLHHDYDLYNKHYDSYQKLIRLKDDLDYYEKCIHANIVKVLRWLEKYDYLRNLPEDLHKTEHLEELNRNVTIRYITSEFNECNEILATELIIRGDLEDKCSTSVVSILGAFLDGKTMRQEDNITSIYDMEVNMGVSNLAKGLSEYASKLENDEYDHYIDIGTNWKISFNMMI